MLKTILYITLIATLGIFIYINNLTLSRKIEDLNEELKILKIDISNIKRKLIKKGKSPIIPIKVTLNKSHINDPFLGDPKAKIVIMAFSNYKCKPCKTFYFNTFKRLKKEYIDTKKIKFIFRDLPNNYNKSSIKLSLFANCVGREGHYWEIHDKLFKNKNPDIELMKITKDIKDIDTQRLKKCILSSSYVTEIERDFKEAKNIGIKGAPSFLIAKTKDNLNFEGVILRGSQPYSVFKEIIDRLSSS